MSKLVSNKLAAASIILATSVLSACISSDNNSSQPVTSLFTPSVPDTLAYEVRVTNLTVGQPMSPVAIFVHNSAQSRLFNIGSASSPALERLAEGGDNSLLLIDYPSVANASSGSPIAPGASASIRLEVPVTSSAGLAFSLATMLVNTNDAFSAVNGVDIASIGLGESINLRTVSYDSGTEANLELAGTIPGPADGGEGFNIVRDDVNNQVTMHGGVVTSADGLANSVLGEQHRWDNPVLSVTINRVR